MTRRKGEYTKSRLDREFPHQVIVSADRCAGANSATIESLCKTLTLGPRHHSVFHQDRWHLVYCFADAAHAELFQEKFGGETFDPKARGRGRNWHMLRKCRPLAGLKMPIPRKCLYQDETRQIPLME
jgi:hypothetical protein